MIPFARMELASSCMRSGSNTRRGWTGFGSISSIRIRVGVSGVGAGCAAAALVTGGLFGKSAVSPLPSALRGPSGSLFIGENLLGQLDITFSARGTHIIAQDGL